MTSLTGIAFVKVEGLGNDFLLIDLTHPSAATPPITKLQAAAPWLCDRRRGVGGDGLLLVTPGEQPGHAGRMTVINSDGSRPEMCGNGLRCVALYLAATARENNLTIATDAGPRRCHVDAATPWSGVVEVDMGPAIVAPPRMIAGHEFIPVNVGNPHAINFVAATADPKALAHTLGPKIEVDPAFPERTNVEFAQLAADGSITLWVWERGCGITAACGTGACATVAAACAHGLVPDRTNTRVHLPGGVLTVSMRDDHAWMTGPAEVAFRGVTREF